MRTKDTVSHNVVCAQGASVREKLSCEMCLSTVWRCAERRHLDIWDRPRFDILSGEGNGSGRRRRRGERDGGSKSQPHVYLDPQPNAAWLPQKVSHKECQTFPIIARFPPLHTFNCGGHAFSHEIPRRGTRTQCSLKLAPCQEAHDPSGDYRFERCSVLLTNPWIPPGCSLRAYRVKFVEQGRWVF